MKKLNVIIALYVFVATISLTSCKETKKENEKQGSHKKEKAMHIEFKNLKTADIFKHYIHIKNALTNSNVDKAKSGAMMLATALGENNAVAKTLAASIYKENDLEEQRRIFSGITKKMHPILLDALTSGTIYKKFCPMAFNNTGGYWFSDHKEIRNPYFGTKMLKCGVIKETLR